MVIPYPHQRKAVNDLKNGSILVGDTGVGKSFVALFYYYEKVIGGSFEPSIVPTNPIDLYIITTSKKRDELDWHRDTALFGISTSRDSSICGIKLVVDSWNNIKKYVGVKGAFFIYDEQRSVGNGVWSKSLIKIARSNRWVMLTATPGDRWIDYISVFLAHGFYKNLTEFKKKHVLYAPYVKYPRIVGYQDEAKLERLRRYIQTVIVYERHTTPHVLDIDVEYPKELVKKFIKLQWNYDKDRPVRNLPEFRHLRRKLINSDPSRIKKILDIHDVAKKLIVFYNFNYELDILVKGFKNKTTVAEYNGRKHETIPTGNNWVYLVHYSSSEAWECFTTNHIAFYSLTYSYRAYKQSMGRIDRLTTKYKNLYYYRLISNATYDKETLKSLNNKKDFNDRNYDSEFINPQE